MVGEQVGEHATALADAIDSGLAAWVERTVVGVAAAAGRPVDDELTIQARLAGTAARAEFAPHVRALLELDIDDQRSNPLALLRQAARYPTAVLAAAGVPEVERDPDQQRLMPTDVYDIAPTKFADIDAAVGDLGIAWGAAKAFEHLRRHPRVRPDVRPDTDTDTDTDTPTALEDSE